LRYERVTIEVGTHEMDLVCGGYYITLR